MAQGQGHFIILPCDRVTHITKTLRKEHRAQRSLIGRFPCVSGASRPHCTATCGGVRYILTYMMGTLQNNNITGARKLKCVLIILLHVCPHSPAMWRYCSTVSFTYSCVRHVSQYIVFTLNTHHWETYIAVTSDCTSFNSKTWHEDEVKEARLTSLPRICSLISIAFWCIFSASYNEEQNGTN